MGLMRTLCCCFGAGQSNQSSGASPAYKACPDEEPLEELVTDPERADQSPKK